MAELDAERARELRIEEQFPDGHVGRGFRYTFGQVEGMVLVQIDMPTESLRLFFEPQHFAQFAREASAVAGMVYPEGT